MRRLLPLAALLWLAGCRASAVTPIEGVPPRPPEVAVAIPADANVLLAASEVVASAEDDQPAYVKVIVNGRESGQTATTPRSKERRWGAVLPPGNHLFKFQAWTQPLPDQWAPLADAWQPPERFIRVEPGLRTVIVLKFSDGGRRHSLQVSREPLTPLR